ncbi:hypothetical protein LMH87_011987 [Akanthomyces muscarius]|uniref:Uncharacterized protein n=1 Tax=Akanthomyces muscarius TaxID=2231603 RepID=A0A9W8QBQ4_AKAMU|nr:hypothetical protein LMH87_011987 [Akanthomyces muscarius]KAJ4151276.1 hypothetical protein LMH87_011987 [Akanthomyces muscarius]
MIEDARARPLAEVEWTELQERRRPRAFDQDRGLQDDETTGINRIDGHPPQETPASPPLFLHSQLLAEHHLLPVFALHTHLATTPHAISTDQEEMARLVSNHHREVLPRFV